MIAQTRSDFIQTVTVNGVRCKDLVANNWDKLVINRPVSYYRVTDSDLQRPDRISMNVYHNMTYWWVLMKYNGICDVWNDLTAGDIIECPNEFDIQAFYASV